MLYTCIKCSCIPFFIAKYIYIYMIWISVCKIVKLKNKKNELPPTPKQIIANIYFSKLSFHCWINWATFLLVKCKLKWPIRFFKIFKTPKLHGLYPKIDVDVPKNQHSKINIPIFPYPRPTSTLKLEKNML